MPEVDLNSPLGQCRSTLVDLGDEQAILATYCADFEIDPYVEMFYFPNDTLKMALFTLNGEILWTRDLGKGIVPGVWFCPVYALDLDGDGIDEIWYVGGALRS